MFYGGVESNWRAKCAKHFEGHAQECLFVNKKDGSTMGAYLSVLKINVKDA